LSYSVIPPLELHCNTIANFFAIVGDQIQVRLWVAFGLNCKLELTFGISKF